MEKHESRPDDTVRRQKVRGEIPSRSRPAVERIRILVAAGLLIPIVAMSTLVAPAPAGSAAVVRDLPSKAATSCRPPAPKETATDEGHEGEIDAADIVPNTADGDASVTIPVERLRFYLNAQGFVVAKAWGNPADGAHSNFICMPAGAASGHHTHSFSYYGVVISGTVMNQAVGSTIDMPLRPGSYWYQKAGEPHVTKCASATPCLFFVTSSGSFDYLAAP